MDHHPVAALFPMLDDTELADLAADIAERGLLQPIVLDAEGRILDGRNRYAACEMASLEPRFETYAGDDPAGYALAVNIQRRNLRPGQRYLVVEQARRMTESTKSYIAEDVSRIRLSEAAVVLDHAPDLVEVVMASGMSLDTAAEKARERKREAAATRAKLDRLAKHGPDLAALVDEERMSVDDAVAALDARELKAQQEAEAKRSAAEEAKRIRQQEHQESVERDRQRVRMFITGWSTFRDLILPNPDGPKATEITDELGETDRLALKKIVTEWAERSE